MLVEMASWRWPNFQSEELGLIGKMLPAPRGDIPNKYPGDIRSIWGWLWRGPPSPKGFPSIFPMIFPWLIIWGIGEKEILAPSEAVVMSQLWIAIQKTPLNAISPGRKAPPALLKSHSPKTLDHDFVWFWVGQIYTTWNIGSQIVSCFKRKSPAKYSWIGSFLHFSAGKPSAPKLLLSLLSPTICPLFKRFFCCRSCPPRT